MSILTDLLFIFIPETLSKSCQIKLNHSRSYVKLEGMNQDMLTASSLLCFVKIGY